MVISYPCDTLRRSLNQKVYAICITKSSGMVIKRSIALQAKGRGDSQGVWHQSDFLASIEAGSPRTG